MKCREQTTQRCRGIFLLFATVEYQLLTGNQCCKTIFLIRVLKKSWDVFSHSQEAVSHMHILFSVLHWIISPCANCVCTSQPSPAAQGCQPFPLPGGQLSEKLCHHHYWKTQPHEAFHSEAVDSQWENIIKAFLWFWLTFFSVFLPLWSSLGCLK